MRVFYRQLEVCGYFPLLYYVLLSGNQIMLSPNFYDQKIYVILSLYMLMFIILYMMGALSNAKNTTTRIIILCANNNTTTACKIISRLYRRYYNLKMLLETEKYEWIEHYIRKCIINGDDAFITALVY